MSTKKSKTKKVVRKPRSKLIGISFGPKGSRQALYVIDCGSMQQFMNERKSIKRYGFNARDIHGTDYYKK